MPQQHGIQTASATYVRACDNAGSLTHWARPGVKSTSSWTLCWVLNPLSHNRNSGCIFFFSLRNESLGPDHIQVEGSPKDQMHEHQAPGILLCILEAACSNVPKRTATCVLLVMASHFHSHDILAVFSPSRSAALFLVHWGPFTSLAAGFPATVFLPPSCHISGLGDEARMAGGGVQWALNLV